MCGHVGVAGDLSSRDKDILEMMLVFSTVRGRDSTGVAFIPRADTSAIQVVKDVGDPFQLFDRLSFYRVNGFSQKAMIGHTRKATVGVVNKANAHPFEVGTFVGAHNGTLRNHYKLPGDSAPLDSLKLFNSFDAVGVKDTIEQVEGAYALVFWDDEEKTLSFLRNKERSLFYAFSDDLKKVYWASEAWMISVACGKHGVKLADISSKDDTEELFVAPLEIDTWWSIKIDPANKAHVIQFVRNEKLEGGVAKPATNFQLPYRTPFDYEDNLDDDIPGVASAKSGGVQPPLANPVITPTAAGSKPTQQSATTTSDTKGSTSSLTVSRVKKPLLTLAHDSSASGSEQQSGSSNELIDFHGDVMDAGDYARTDCQCSFCQKDVDYNDALKGGIGKWLSSAHFLCSTCYNTKELAA